MCGTRYYDPETGRFINSDDISYLDPNTINGLNLYAYCLNNPVMMVDPNGNFPMLAWILIGAVIGAGAGVGIGYAAGARGTDLIWWGLGGAIIGGLLGWGAYHLFAADGALAMSKIGISKHSLSNEAARLWYNEKVTSIPNLLDDAQTLKSQAKYANSLRNTYKIQARKLMSDRALAHSLYSTNPIHGFRFYVNKYLEKGFFGDDLFRQIIFSSARPNPFVNAALGIF